MEVIKINRKITNDRIEELNRFIGKFVEIIILSDEKNNMPDESLSVLDLKGALNPKIDGMDFQNEIRKEWDRV